MISVLIWNFVAVRLTLISIQHSTSLHRLLDWIPLGWCVNPLRWSHSTMNSFQDFLCFCQTINKLISLPLKWLSFRNNFFHIRHQSVYFSWFSCTIPAEKIEFAKSIRLPLNGELPYISFASFDTFVCRMKWIPNKIHRFFAGDFFCFRFMSY